MRRIMLYRPSPAIVISVLALLVAMGGIAVASVPGRAGTISACYMKNGGGLRIIDAARHGHAGKCSAREKGVAWNQRGIPGVKGDPGPPGVKGDPGPPGVKGDPGPVTGVLASGVSEKGAFVARDTIASDATVETAISFPLTLAVGVPAFYVPSGSSAVPQCTGSAANPTAAQGTLCVYESVKGNARFSVAGPFIDPVTTVSTSNTQPFGVILRVLPSAAGDTFVYGSWAVTAP